MTKEQLRELYNQTDKSNQEFIQWNGSNLYVWEYNLLKQIGAISDKGILYNYPKLKITTADEKTYYEDYDADIYVLNEKRNIINSDKRNRLRAEIENVPKTYLLYKEVRKDLNDEWDKQQYAKQINTPPVELFGY